MANQCLICNNPYRKVIDHEIVSGANLMKLAREYDLSYNSLYRHAADHVSTRLVQALEKRELAESWDLLTTIDGILKKTENIFNRNYEAGKDGLALKALSQQTSTIDLLAKISYSLMQAKQAEIELLKLENGESEDQIGQEIQEGLKCLTDAELLMFQKLQNKILKKNTTIIIPDKKRQESNNTIFRGE